MKQGIRNQCAVARLCCATTKDNNKGCVAPKGRATASAASAAIGEVARLGKERKPVCVSLPCMECECGWECGWGLCA